MYIFYLYKYTVGVERFKLLILKAFYFLYFSKDNTQQCQFYYQPNTSRKELKGTYNNMRIKANIVQS